MRGGGRFSGTSRTLGDNDIQYFASQCASPCVRDEGTYQAPIRQQYPSPFRCMWARFSSLSTEKPPVYRGGLCTCRYFPSEQVLPALRAICKEASRTAGSFAPMHPAQGPHSTTALNAAPNPTGIPGSTSLSSWMPWQHLL